MWRKRVRMVRRVAASIGAILVATGAGPGLAQQVASKTVWDGVYTTEQADRAIELYNARCAACHAANLRGVEGGGGPALVRSFPIAWNGKTVAELFDFMKMNM